MIPSRQSPKPMSPMNSASPYMQYSPSGGPSPHHRSSSGGASELEKYLSELLKERKKMIPFMQVLPNCGRLLNQEIMRLTSLVGTTGPCGDHDSMEHDSPISSVSNRQGLELNSWSPFQSEYNFVGRLLGPRGNSLKRVENTTGCRVFIRGRGSVRDADKEESLRDKPGYEHINEPLHVLIEAELPANIVDLQLNHACEIIKDLLTPVEETYDYYKKQQLRELAMLNGTLREDTLSWNGSDSPFDNSGMKRAKTRV